MSYSDSKTSCDVGTNAAPFQVYAAAGDYGLFDKARITIMIEAREGSNAQRLMAVLDLDSPSMAAERERLSAETAVAVEVIDTETWLEIRRLAAAGILQFVHESRTLHRASGWEHDPEPSAHDRILA